MLKYTLIRRYFFTTSQSFGKQSKPFQYESHATPFCVSSVCNSFKSVMHAKNESLDFYVQFAHRPFFIFHFYFTLIPVIL